jgi:hypothetical protein
MLNRRWAAYGLAHINTSESHAALERAVEQLSRRRGRYARAVFNPKVWAEPDRYLKA